MTFTGLSISSLFLWTSVISAGLVLLHFLTRRNTSVTVVTLLFWQSVQNVSPVRRLWGKFRHPLAFFLLLLISVLVLLALCKPVWNAGDESEIARVLVIDAGMFMNDDQTNVDSRIDQACKVALDEASRTPRQGRLAVVVADPWPRVLHGFDDDRVLLPLRMKHITASDRPADLRMAGQVACSLLEGDFAEIKEVVMISDTSGMLDALPQDSIQIQKLCVGCSQDNTAILAAQLDHDPACWNRGTLQVRLGRWAKEAGTALVEIVESDGGLPATEQVSFNRGRDEQTVAFSGIQTDGRNIKIRIAEGGGALRGDDVMNFPLPQWQGVSVQVASNLPRPLRAIIACQPWVKNITESDRDDAKAITLIDRSGKPINVRIAANGPKGEAGQPLCLPDETEISGQIGSGRSLGNLPNCHPLLICQGQIHAALKSDSNQTELLLSEALVAEDASCWRRGEFIWHASNWLSKAAGRGGEVRVIPFTENYGQMSNSDVACVYGSRKRSDLLSAGENLDLQIGHSFWWTVSGFEWFLWLAGLVMLVEEILVISRRIP